MTNIFTAMVSDDVGDEAPTTMQDEDVAVYETSSFLSRILFCLFAEDAGLFEAGLFTRFVKEECSPGNLGAQLQALFDILNTSENRRRNDSGLLAEFPYVNGHLFEERLPTTRSPGKRGGSCQCLDGLSQVCSIMHQIAQSRYANYSIEKRSTNADNRAATRALTWSWFAFLPKRDVVGSSFVNPVPDVDTTRDSRASSTNEYVASGLSFSDSIRRFNSSSRRTAMNCTQR